VCDHRHYFDGYCAIVGGNWHFSYPGHNRHFGLNPMQFAGVAFYTGPHHTGSLINTGRTHRWRRRGHHGDKHTVTMCTARRGISTGSFHFKGKRLNRRRVTGRMTRANILKTCRKHNEVPVCDHSHYYYHGQRDCAPFGHWHFSHPHHNRHYRVPLAKVIGAFFYTSNHHTGSLLNTGHSHRWANPNGHHKDRDMDTFCTGGMPVEQARGKPAYQSSTGYGGPPSRAVDGNTNGHYGHRSCTHTRKDHQPWWQVNLGGRRAVAHVDVWNRQDCCSNRLRHYHVYVGHGGHANGHGTHWKHCGRIGHAHRHTRVGCGYKTGDKVRIWIRGRREYLTLCEVKVTARSV